MIWKDAASIMKLTLRLRFHTRFGESLLVAGNHSALGNNDPALATPLHYLNHDFWETTLELDQGSIPEDGLNYSYVFRDVHGALSPDWGRDRCIPKSLLSSENILIVDSWNEPGFPENAFSTQPFRDVLMPRGESPASRPGTFTHVFRVRVPLVQPGQKLCLIGSVDALGNWEVRRAIPMQRGDASEFTAFLDLGHVPFPLSYKYVVTDAAGAPVRFEDGVRTLDGAPAGARAILNDGFAVLPSAGWRGAGVAIPVFSLRSETSFGVGEFTDLRQLADWCVQTGLKLIQILPVNDTTATHTWVDSYPYAAISAFALHPLYLNLSEVVTDETRPLLKELESERRRLNSLPEVDYEAVMNAKLGLLKRIFARQKKATLGSRAFKEFFEANREWLVPYAVFCSLRDRFGTPDWSQWPEHFDCTPGILEQLSAPGAADYDSVALHYFIQFHLDRQLQSAAAYAHEHGVVLKGDIAIGVARYGADTWQSPELFHLEMQAGAPPDPFAEKGQNWGFPTYNWPRMQEDGFGWWKRRFAQMARYFDAFRIDHILGFFRIWSIPLDAVEGILGRFEPAIPVRRDEFAGRGIAFERTRFAEPFISNLVLQEIFGPDAEQIKREFMLRLGADRYALKPEFATQKLIDAHFQKLESTTENRSLKLGLYGLASNVIVFEDEEAGGEQFHFRLDMPKTTSFRNFDSDTQSKLLDLYNEYFFRRQDAFWEQQAMQKLPALKGVTDMLICGEDLGMVPHCVPGVMKRLGLLSLEIQRMPKALGLTFSRPADAPYLSVVTPSTHDMSTIRGWWREDAVLAQRFYNEELSLPGLAPATCSTEVNELVIKQHLRSPAMWSIFQLQDLLGSDEQLRRPDVDSERINIPANPKHYWRFRMHLTLEKLLGEEAFNARLKSLLASAGR